MMYRVHELSKEEYVVQVCGHTTQYAWTNVVDKSLDLEAACRYARMLAHGMSTCIVQPVVVLTPDCVRAFANGREIETIG